MAKRRPRKPPTAKPPSSPAFTRSRWVGGGMLAAAIVAFVWFLGAGRSGDRVEVTVPEELSPMAEAGRAAFEANCGACHGPAAGGTDQGPPLVHPIYEPGHHADASFVLAAKRGVAQHHWDFGAMPPQPQVGDRSLQQIVAYVRELQRANGIE